jgi:hypothetical protein
MVGKLVPCSKKTVEPNAPLAQIVEDIGKLGEGLTKQDHVIIMGGPGKSLKSNYHYSVQNDLNFIAESISNIDVGFVKLFERHDKPWMNERVRNVNLQLN